MTTITQADLDNLREAHDALGQSRALMAALRVLARAHQNQHAPVTDRRRTAEIAIGNAECASQLEIKDAVLRGALVDSVAAAFVA